MKNKGVVIAKISALSDDELDRLLRVQFRKNIESMTSNVVSNVSYSWVDKNKRGPVMTNKKTESRLKMENEIAAYRQPSMQNYNPDESAVRPRAA